MTYPTAGSSTKPLETIPETKTYMLLATIARVLLGAIFFIFGLNGFLHFIPMPPPTGVAAEFMMGLIKAGYLLPFMAAVQVLCGALLLSGTLVPLSLLLLAPITLNILLFHLGLAPAGLPMAIFIVLAQLLLMAYYWPVFQPLLKTENVWKRNR